MAIQDLLANPLTLLQLLSTPEGQAAAAVHLAASGMSPEDFTNSITKPSSLEGGTGGGQQPVANPFDSLFGFNSPANMAVAPGITPAAAAPTGVAAPAAPAAANPWLDPAMIQRLLGAGTGMVSALQPPQAHIPQAYAPAPQSHPVLNPASLPQFLQVLLAGQPQAPQNMSLGALFRQGGL